MLLFCLLQVWDMDTLQCTMTLNDHTDAVTSLICWDQYLLSSSSDRTIKVWACIEAGSLEVIYTHTEENVSVDLILCVEISFGFIFMCKS